METPLLQAVVQQFHSHEPITDPSTHLRNKLSKSGLLNLIEPGQEVALAVGSRRINSLLPLVRTLVEALRERGAKSFILPAMGSHGGATAQGQRVILEKLGISEKSCGAPVVSTMEVKDFGPVTQEGAHLIVAADALRADWVIPLNKIKAHTAFQGKVESGLLKMLVVGLGKEEGARSFHQYALRSPFPRYMLELARGVMTKIKIPAGVAVLEDAGGRLFRLEVGPPEEFERIDQELLACYKELAPRLPFDQADLLIVDWMGKDISGAGMDTNVIGRSRHPVRPEPERPRIRRIWVRGLTEASQGNAKGVGLADFVSASLVARMDHQATIVNSLSALVPEHAFLPPVLEPERRILFEALRTTGVIDPKRTKVAWIKHTATLERLLVSSRLASSLEDSAQVELIGKRIAFRFDEKGDLGSFEEHWRAASGENL